MKTKLPDILYFDEYFLFVKEIQETPANHDAAKVVQKQLPCIRKKMDHTAENEISGKTKIDIVVGLFSVLLLW